MSGGTKGRRLHIIDMNIKETNYSNLCNHMNEKINVQCTYHSNPLDCPDSVLVYVPPIRECGMPIRDGKHGSASSYIVIYNCPWCGKKLPKNLRDEWLTELKKMGIEDPILSPDIPEEFKTDEWWKRRDL